MVQKIKRMVWGVGAFLVSLPVVVHAQWVPPSTDLRLDSLGLSRKPISMIIFDLLRWLLFIMGFLAIIAFVISAIYYLTSAGDDKKIETAKTIMIYGIVGTIVGLSGVIILNAIDIWLFGTTSQF